MVTEEVQTAPTLGLSPPVSSDHDQLASIGMESRSPV